jgi:hypothetical protein
MLIVTGEKPEVAVLRNDKCQRIRASLAEVVRRSMASSTMSQELILRNGFAG